MQLRRVDEFRPPRISMLDPKARGQSNDVISLRKLPALGRLRPSLGCLPALPDNRETAAGSAPCFQS